MDKKVDIDLDAMEAARREKGAKGPVVGFRGQRFELPTEIPFALVEIAARDVKGKRSDAEWTMFLVDALPAILGDDLKRFRALSPSAQNVADFVNAAIRAYGTEPGNSSASGSSSTSNGSRSRRTSRATTTPSSLRRAGDNGGSVPVG